MASIRDRLLALEALRPIHDGTEADHLAEHAEYMARVMLGFVADGHDKAQAMIRRGVPADEARRFSAMGFHATQRELMAKLHILGVGAAI